MEPTSYLLGVSNRQAEKLAESLGVPMPLTRWQCLKISGTGVRHEAPCNRVEVKDLRRWAVAAAW
jgi:hypothetical protein